MEKLFKKVKIPKRLLRVKVSKKNIMNPIKIRKASLSDIDLILFLSDQLGYPASSEEMEKRLKKIIQNEDHIVFVAELEREIFLDGYYKAFGMGCGPCRICKSCPEECPYPRLARPSMEACGIDVYATARKAGFPIEVVKDYDRPSNRFGLILIE